MSLGNRPADDLAQQLSPPRPCGRAAFDFLLSRGQAVLLGSPRATASLGLNYGLAIEPEDEPAGSRLTRLHLVGMPCALVQADDHLAPALHIQLAEQVVDMQLRCRQADVQPTGDLLVTEPRRDQLGGLPFAPGERGCRG